MLHWKFGEKLMEVNKIYFTIASNTKYIGSSHRPLSYKAIIQTLNEYGSGGMSSRKSSYCHCVFKE